MTGGEAGNEGDMGTGSVDKTLGELEGRVECGLEPDM